MRRKLFCLVSLIVVMGLAGYVLAQEPNVEIPDAGGTPPVLDGVMDEIWSLSTEQTLTITKEGTSPDNPMDCSGGWRALWDWDYLYILVDVNDESLVQDSGATEGWNDDRVEIFIDGDNSKDSTTDGVNDYQYNFRWNNGEVETPVEWYFQDSGIDKLEGVEYAIATTEDGYLIEVALPWSTLTGEPPLPGGFVGIDVMIDDDDDGDGRDTQISW
ncbi:MAG: sugar-binding protein, partial [Phycisphaerales bacterium]